MRLGIHFSNFSLPGSPTALPQILSDTARAADEAGCEVFTLPDHLFQTEADREMLEGYTALGFLAGCTERMKLGLLVGGVTYRYPGLLVKAITTLDVLSGGRALLGLGAAWYEREHAGLGVPFPSLADRFDMLEETLQVVLQMWSTNDGPYRGRHYRLAETLCVPAPIQRPRPPIVVGGGGERKTLLLAARYADYCNLIATDPSMVAHKLDVLKRHCEDVGREASEIRKTILVLGVNPLDDVDAFLASMESYARLGVELVVIPPWGDDPAAIAVQLGERVIPSLDGIGVA